MSVNMSRAALKPALGIDKGTGRHQGPHGPAIVVQETDVSLLADSHPPPFEQFLGPGAVAVKDEVPLRPAQHVLGLAAQQLGHPRIDEGDAGVGVQQPDPLDGGFHDLAVFLFALAQGRRGPFALRSGQG